MYHLIEFRSNSPFMKNNTDYVIHNGVAFTKLETSDYIPALMFTMLRRAAYQEFRNSSLIRFFETSSGQYKEFKELVRGIVKYFYMNDISSTTRDVIHPFFDSIDYGRNHHAMLTFERCKFQSEHLMCIVSDDGSQISLPQLMTYYDEFEGEMVGMYEIATKKFLTRSYDSTSPENREWYEEYRALPPKKRTDWSEKELLSDAWWNSETFSHRSPRGERQMNRDSEYEVCYNYLDSDIEFYGVYDLYVGWVCEPRFSDDKSGVISIVKTPVKMRDASYYDSRRTPESELKSWKVDKKRKQWDKDSRADRNKSMKRPYWKKNSWEAEKSLNRMRKRLEKRGAIL